MTCCSAKACRKRAACIDGAPRLEGRSGVSDLLLSQGWTLGGRYWLAESYEARHAAGEEPQSIDKEFLRLWFRANCDPYGDAVAP